MRRCAPCRRSAVSRSFAGRTLGEALAEPNLTSPVYATAEGALEHPCDVFVEYPTPARAPDPTSRRALLAIHRVGSLVGVHRGLDTLMDL